MPKNQELMNLGTSIKKIAQDIKPIFIVGVPRCGSTLIEKVIASGSENIKIGEETALISFFVGEKMSLKESFNLNIKNFKEKIITQYKNRGLINKKSNNIFNSYDFIFLFIL